jgi:hypothetical protein
MYGEQYFGCSVQAGTNRESLSIELSSNEEEDGVA